MALPIMLLKEVAHAHSQRQPAWLPLVTLQSGKVKEAALRGYERLSFFAHWSQCEGRRCNCDIVAKFVLCL
jgi:hypothetical protein